MQKVLESIWAGGYETTVSELNIQLKFLEYALGINKLYFWIKITLMLLYLFQNSFQLSLRNAENIGKH